mmetsp:Transcript_10041/g.17148  ORF Transcript_10041/g.17148 Transcript_10041/m.17148 type:complete len:87 (+) Transcript_10041:114-374(+)
MLVFVHYLENDKIIGNTHLGLDVMVQSKFKSCIVARRQNCAPRIQYSETLGFEQFIFIGAGNNDTVALLPPPSFWNDSSFDDCTTC